MKKGDKVKRVKGNPFGAIGIIKYDVALKGPVDLTLNPRGLKDEPYVLHFEVEAEDGTTFSAPEDDLEIIE
ncbi:hypothetical protein ACFLYR_03585 [Chloroflexota bacterium]